LNEKAPPLLESVMGGKKEEWATNKNLMVDRLGKWAEAAGSSGVKVAVKAHAGNAVYASDQLLWLYRAVNHPALTLTYDYSHYKAEGFDMETTMREVIPHAGFIHVKDVALWKPLRFLFPGEGSIDWVQYFRILRELKYTGPILVEVSAHIHKLPNYEPLPSAQLCYDALSKARDTAYAS
jgi:sugar phosphate isomerase/epimerase